MNTLLKEDTLGFAGFEFGVFRLKPGVSEADMLAAAQQADKAFLSKQEGFLGHVILKGKDGSYADVGFASSQEKAEAICAQWMDNAHTLRYLEFIEPDSVDMTFWTRIK